MTKTEEIFWRCADMGVPDVNFLMSVTSFKKAAEQIREEALEGIKPIEGKLIKLAASLLTEIPLSPFEDDWHFSKSTPKRDRLKVMESIEGQTLALKDVALELKEIAKCIRKTNSIQNGKGSGESE